MKTNIAIIIGVSEYSSQGNLPSCKTDSQILYEILSKSSKYSEILLLNENTKSSVIKESLIAFFENVRNSSGEIGEIFFYFSGHGMFSDNEFFYILSDFDFQKRNQTSLKNSEIDSLVRALNSELFVKVIDACQSGNQYIKGQDFLSKYFDNSASAFNKCYFMSSSTQTQFSYASENISYFTSSFINSIKFSPKKEVRYADVINFISDEFLGNQLQTPLFTTQAYYTESFIEKNEDIVAYLNSDIEEEITSQEVENKSDILLSAIKDNAKKYLSKEQAFELLNKIKTTIDNFKFPSDDLYEINVSYYNSYEVVAKKGDILNWIKSNPNSNLFIKKTTSYQPKDGKIRPFGFSALTTSLEKLSNPNFLKDNELVISDFDVEIEGLPFKTVQISFDGKYPNIDDYQFTIIYFMSNETIVFFYYLSNWEMVNWDESELNLDFEWETDSFAIADKTGVLTRLTALLEEASTTILEDLRLRFVKK